MGMGKRRSSVLHFPVRHRRNGRANGLSSQRMVYPRMAKPLVPNATLFELVGKGLGRRCARWGPDLQANVDQVCRSAQRFSTMAALEMGYARRDGDFYA